MSLPFDIEIALRYVRGGGSRSRDRFISFISGLSMAGIGLGVAALIVVISVMNGFQKEVRDRMLSVIAHVEVLAPADGFENWENTLHTIEKADKRVVGVAPYVAGQSMLAFDDNLRPALVRGINLDLEPKVSDFHDVVAGSLSTLQPGSFNIAIGIELAKQLNVTPGDKITIIAPAGQVTPAGVIPRLKAFRVTAVVSTGHYEYDSGLVLMNIEDAARFYRTAGPTGLRIKLTDMNDAPAVASELEKILPATYWVRDWSVQNRTWFAAVHTEKRMMFIILTLIIAVAAFNLVSMLVMTVKDKRGEIAILRTLGASPSSILRIFIVQGALVGWIGTFFGVLIGYLLALYLPNIIPVIEHIFNVQFLPRSIYFISELPSDPRFSDISTIVVVALVLSVVSTIYPSWRASRAEPAEALRYE
ncbi:lipoprotein-releasing ABC transporter permease subunit [Limnobacter sp.]|uniref:lipoprotein-releasing ABC transporter permease subunit n=1 Tax=Limnobacter sp. TaxID=2003368 RepID=UPI0025903873|nr:lipoprotein-releasing ABC transporter permease subunit [Limnobacter sp.]